MASRIIVTTSYRAVLNVALNSQKFIVNGRSIHLAHCVGNSTLKSHYFCNTYRRLNVVRDLSVRNSSTSSVEATENIDPLDIIPDPPTISETIVETIATQAASTSYKPTALLQSMLEWIHVTYDIPWWLTIATVTLCVRMLMFPVVLQSQKNAIHMNNHMPEFQELHKEMTDARMRGNMYEAAIAGHKVMKFQKEHNINPIKSMFPILMQAPVFITFYLTLRNMVSQPIEDFKYGGLWWFTDLTVADPYYILPVLTAATLYITIELGIDAPSAAQLGVMKYLVKGIPVLVLIFTSHFPSAVLCYWFSSNAISLLQAQVLKIPVIKKKLKIPDRIVHKKKKTNMSGEFVQDIKKVWTNAKIVSNIRSREEANMKQFYAAGKAPIVKTYKYDPTKVTPEELSERKMR